MLRFRRSRCNFWSALTSGYAILVYAIILLLIVGAIIISIILGETRPPEILRLKGGAATDDTGGNREEKGIRIISFAAVTQSSASASPPPHAIYAETNFSTDCHVLLTPGRKAVFLAAAKLNFRTISGLSLLFRKNPILRTRIYIRPNLPAFWT